MNEVLIAFVAATLVALALSGEPGLPSEKAGSRIAQDAPPAGEPAPADQKAQAPDDRDDDDDDKPGADDDDDRPGGDDDDGDDD
jgi:hypothetical protein